jgi:heterogeneous nuclear ribonucleoprotein L
MAMPFYEDSLAPLAKRPRVDYNTNTIERVGHPVLLPPQLVEIQLAKKSSEGEQPNHVLLFTVLNPTYPITCDVLHTIASPFGKLLRVVIFKKNGVQAMLEFDSLESAQRAKDNLHGCDIYSGCCTLKIEYAKPTKLNVYKNDTESFDYTNPTLGKNVIEQPCTALATQRPVLLKDPLLSAGEPTVSPLTVAIRPHHQMYATPQQVAVSLGSGQPINMASLLTTALPRLPSPTHQSGMLMHQSHHPSHNSTVMGGQAGTMVQNPSMSPPSIQPQGSVTMVYGLDCHKMSCIRIFNIFCLYGNVVRVKFLKTKEGCAMVQMGDSLAVERVVTNLNNITFFDSKMQLGFSKQAFLADVQQPYELPDGTHSFMDFMGNKNNRFINPEMASKNRIQPPSKILHFFNTPPGLEASDIEDIFLGQNTPRPKCIKMFPSKTERSSSGLIEFECLSEALESLVMANHVPVENPNGKFPYIMKLCFSSSKAIPAVIH